MADIFDLVQGIGGDIFGPSSLEGGVGTADIIAPVPTFSGAGSSAQQIFGSADINAPLPTLAAAGLVNAPNVGSAGMAAAVPAVSAFGTVVAGGVGTAAIVAPAAVLDAAGTVTAQQPPVIVDGGNLAVTIPFRGTAADKSYPAIAAWIASFTASDEDGPLPVTNNAPFILYQSGSPISVTFTSTGIGGTTTIARTLTINVAADTGSLVPNVADLRIQLPGFMDPVLWPYTSVAGALTRAQCFISTDTRCGRLRGDCRMSALYLMGGHLLTVQQLAASGEATGNVTSATIDKVSVTVEPPPGGTAYTYWMNLSPYGAELLALLSAKAAGGFYIGGNRERQGFRKIGGGFW